MANLLIQVIHDISHVIHRSPFWYGKIFSVVRLLYWNLWLKRTTRYYLGKLHDLFYIFDTESDASATAYVTPFLEYPLFFLIKSIVKKNDIFIDVGSNIGFYTLIAAQQKAQIYAFEPNQNALANLQMNLN